jgi:uncharacterized membrane protein YjjB (DUF3815 family)
MKKFWPLFVIAAGILILVCGILYADLTAGVIYEHPTPAQAADDKRHSEVFMTFLYLGFGAVLVGIVTGLVRLFRPSFIK